MKNKILIAVLAAALAGPAAAATLDFTADNETSGTILGTTWEVRARNNSSLTNSTHRNNVGCTGQGWNFACAADGNEFDVGFGVNGRGTNDSEIDGRIPGRDEFVEVVFGDFLNVTGFAGMLTYANEAPVSEGSREQVRLQYRNSDGDWTNAPSRADPLFAVNEGNGRFDTVGLAFMNGLSLFTDRVRFGATGRGTADDGTFNVTAAGLEVSAVPVPAALPLLLVGMGALGVASRRKKRRVA